MFDLSKGEKMRIYSGQGSMIKYFGGWGCPKCGALYVYANDPRFKCFCGQWCEYIKTKAQINNVYDRALMESFSDGLAVTAYENACIRSIEKAEPFTLIDLPEWDNQCST